MSRIVHAAQKEKKKKNKSLQSGRKKKKHKDTQPAYCHPAWRLPTDQTAKDTEREEHKTTQITIELNWRRERNTDTV